VSEGLKIPAGVEVSGTGRVKYPKNYPEYGQCFGRTGVSVRGWVAHGKKVGELPPLDDPDDLVRWWKSYMKQKVPDGVQKAAREVRDNESPDDFALEAPAVEVPSVSVSESISLEVSAGGNASDSLDRLRSASALSFQRYQKALKDGDQADAESWRKDWLAAEQAQRQWEKDINSILEQRGELVSRAKILGLLASLASALRRNFQASKIEFGRELAPDLGDEELERRAAPYVEACFVKLRESEFAEALQIAG
jgi:hypothetical protein